MPKAIDDLHNTIIREARPILKKHGYEQLTIRNVARICNVAVGTVYRYFDSKDELVSHILQADWSATAERLRSTTATVDSPVEGLRCISGYIREFIRGYSRAWLEYRTIYRYSPALTDAHEFFVGDIAAIVHPMMQRFDPNFNPVVSKFIATTVLSVSAEPESKFDELVPVLEKLCR